MVREPPPPPKGGKPFEVGLLEPRRGGQCKHFFLPNYFSINATKKNDQWSFIEFKKKKKKYPSSPYSNQEFKNKDFLKINLKVGQILCFSGHHIHGSQIGEKRRVNLETRTFCSKDNIKFKIPSASDNSNKQIKFNWFKSLYDDSRFKL